MFNPRVSNDRLLRTIVVDLISPCLPDVHWGNRSLHPLRSWISSAEGDVSACSTAGDQPFGCSFSDNLKFWISKFTISMIPPFLTGWCKPGFWWYFWLSAALPGIATTYPQVNIAKSWPILEAYAFSRRRVLSIFLNVLCDNISSKRDQAVILIILS